MKLSVWIESIGGRAEAASRLKVTPEAISYWLSGKATPKWETVFRILDESKGKVSPREILEETKLKERIAAKGAGV